MKRVLLTALRTLTPAAFVLAAGVGLHLLFLVSLRTGWLNPLFNDTMHRFGPGCDFFSIYAAGVKARMGESVYTIGDRVDAAPYAYAFRYAPVVAYTLGLALSLLPNLAAYAAWLIGCELALLRNISLTAELAPDRATAFYLAALWLCYTPYYLELYVGQFTFVTAGLVFWAVLGWNRSARPGRPSGALSLGWADRFWSAAVWLKMMPLFYAPIALLRGRGLPLIVLLAPGHFVIAEKRGAAGVRIWDPEGAGLHRPARRWMGEAEWKRAWSGIAVTVTERSRDGASAGLRR